MPQFALPGRRPFRRLPSRRNALELAALILVLLFSAMLTGALIWSEKSLTMQAETDRLRQQTGIIDEHLRHQLGGVRNALSSARQAFADPQQCGVTCRQILLKSLKRAMPGVRALIVVDRHGKIQMSDDDLRDRQLDDRDYTANIARMRSTDILYLSPPYENTPGVFNIKLSLAIIDDSGANAGAVSAILNPDYFDGAMRSALYAPDMNSAITEDSGRRIVFVPDDPAAMRVSDTTAESFYMRHLRSGQTVTVLKGPDSGSATGGATRLVVQRTMQPQKLGLDKTLVISLGRDLAQMQAGWQHAARLYALAWGLFCAFSAIGLALLQRRRSTLERMEQAREQEALAAAERVELALNGANLGLWDWDLQRDLRSVDARADAMLGYAPGERAREPGGGGEWRSLVHPEDWDVLDAALASHLRDSSRSYEVEYRMRHRNGHWVWLQSRGRVIERDAAGTALRMVGTRMDISARKLAEAEIAHLAFYDGLTKLPNRRLLLDRLGHAIAKCERGGGHGAVFFVDLDNFKSLNDTMGHDVGDRLLEMVAFRLQQVTRETDTVARLGGDEFVVLLEDLGTSSRDAAAHAELVAQKVLAALGLCYPLDGHELRSTPSIGVVLFGGGHHTINDLLRQADMAMYEAKAAGRNTFRFFDPRMQAAVDETATLEADLRFAVPRRELQLYYQPVVDGEGRISGVEGLLRWRHPQRGLIFPGDFIAQAEKSGLIIEIGDWVLDTACQQLLRWSGSPETAHLSIAINVSARQFRQPDFAESVLHVLRRTGADPRRLKLELTESMLLADVEDVVAKMTLLKSHDVSFSLDDFGTGYSSLNYLKRLPIDQLKIDRSFVHDMLHTPHASTIVRAIVSLAHSLGLSVVAEGVETEEEWASLCAIGCGGFQGFLFAQALPIEELTPLLGRRSGSQRPMWRTGKPGCMLALTG